jgi:hypothetical protein
MWLLTSVSQHVGRLRQEDCEFEASMGCIARLFKSKNKIKYFLKSF